MAFVSVGPVAIRKVRGRERVRTCSAGGAGAGGAAGGFSGGRGDEQGDARSSDSIAAVLAVYGKKPGTLTPELRALDAEQLRSYFEATKSGLAKYLAEVWPAWRGKMAADPKFGFKLLMEETVGLGLAVSGMVAARGKEILNELDFAFCDMVVGAVLNFTALWMAAPTISAATEKAASPVMRYIESLPPSLFAASPPGAKYTTPARVAGALFTGVKFAGVGLVAGFVGTCISYALLALRNKSSDGSAAIQTKKPPSLLENSLGWSGFMFISSSPRYQGVAGLERAAFRFAPEAVAKTTSGLLRTGNNILGGANWVWYAKAVGLQ